MNGAILGLAEEMALHFEVGLSALSRSDHDKRNLLPHPEFEARMTEVCVLPPAGRFQVALRPVGSRPIQLMHDGIANLPGQCRVAAMWVGAAA